eukprot:TRINITY_DN15283_c0_g1_i1.p1 TRINITY_DN15283_c0_g1~~TRINITY_DN15283_c0_g1_i1.p1  ORF type:complete len:302 (+),score=91.01 TRINITY_DN15283_c0_g1_i1:80-985(+)
MCIRDRYQRRVRERQLTMRVSGASLFVASLCDPSADEDTNREARKQGAKAWRDLDQSTREAWATQAVQHNAERCGLGLVRSVLVQMSWDDQEDQELLEMLRATGLPVRRCRVQELVAAGAAAHTMVFADSCVVQSMLPPGGTVDTYHPCFHTLYNRRITRGALAELVHSIQLPFFVKPAAAHKSFSAQVVRSTEAADALLQQQGAGCEVYASELLEFTAEVRLFIGDNKLWAQREYSEYMIGHRLANAAPDLQAPLVCAALPSPAEHSSAWRRPRCPMRWCSRCWRWQHSTSWDMSWWTVG